MGARNRGGRRLSYRPARLHIGWRNSFLGIDSGAPYTFKNTSSALPVCSNIAESECESILSGNTEVEFRKTELYSLGNSSCRASSTWDRGARKSGDGTEEVTGVELPRKIFPRRFCHISLGNLNIYVIFCKVEQILNFYRDS